MRDIQANEIPVCCGGTLPELWRTGNLFHLICPCGRYLSTILDTKWAAPTAGKGAGWERARKRKKRQ